MRKVIYFSMVLLFCVSMVKAQENGRHCASEHIKTFYAKHPEFQQQFIANESLIQQVVQANKYRGVETIYKIPVVVHVIHNGEPIGSGANISDAQINSQIEALNKDYRLSNNDSLPVNHGFYSVVADTKIQFCLAVLDTNGMTTTGITRHNMNKAGWTTDEIDQQIKPSTSWNSEKYLNIWTVVMTGNDASTMGYAFSPTGSKVIEDGVVIQPIYFGTTGTVTAPMDRGRTATHEIGHYLNLAHIWGDADCGDDQVADTEPQKAESSGCPSYPSNANNGCSGAKGEMFMNYMDYSDDHCMAMFTKGQKDRMRAALVALRPKLITNNNACSQLTSVAELEDKPIFIYPNPGNTNVTVQLVGNNCSFTIKLLDMQGKIMFEQFCDAGKTLNIPTSSFANGTYFVSITSEKEIYTSKLVIIQ